MGLLPKALKCGGDTRGFTLIETLVAMLSAVVVVGALYSILDISVSQTAQITDQSQATQNGRTTINKLNEDLKSACISSGFTPVKEAKEKTTGEKEEESRLVFVNAYTSNAEITEALKHEIVWEKSSGLIVDKTYKSSGGSWPEFTFSSTYTKTRLGENISQAEVGKKFVPIFQYYEYTKESTGLASNEALSTLKLIELETKGSEKELSSKNLKEAAAVEISFNQSPVNKYTAESRAVDFKNQVTLSFSVPNAETPIEDKPCE
jgi:type II secretory pathway pseudopilin PulG